MHSSVFQEYGESPTSNSSPSSLYTTTSGESGSRWSISLRKGTHSTRNPYPIYHFLSYHKLLPSYFSLLSLVYCVAIPKSVNEALDHIGW